MNVSDGSEVVSDIAMLHVKQLRNYMIWQAKEAGSTRFCMGAAWRDTVGRKTNFNQILDYVKEIR